MNENEKWNKICEFFDKNRSSPEDVIQKAWEKIFSERFGYSSLDGEIDVHRPIDLGSTERVIPDIIIKNPQKDLFVVELKRETLPVDSNLGQLFSYLKQLKCDLGILICNKICLIDYDYNVSDSDQTKFEIEFTKDNPDGIKFIELFSRANFSKEVIKKFIGQKSASFQNIQTIKKELENSKELIRGLLKEHFLKNYSVEEFEEAIKEFEIRIVKKGSRPIIEQPQTTNVHISKTSAPPIEFYINGQEVSSDKFKELLLKVKRAERTWYYSSNVEKEIWDAKNMTLTSNLKGNIKSTKYRNWKESGLVKVVCEINE